MDIDLTRTFLQIVRTGSLVAAASQLNVTQTAVTARIKTLETQLNCRLFVRSKAGATLTADGETMVLPITASSPAFDFAGPCTGTDQRDVVRPQGAACDSGAYEVDLPPTTALGGGPSGYAFSSSEAGSTFQCRIDGPAGAGTFAACTSPYVAPALAPGTYTLKVSLQGYKGYALPALRVGTQQFLTLDVTLEVGQLAETVTVRGDTPVIETSTASTGTVTTTAGSAWSTRSSRSSSAPIASTAPRWASASASATRRSTRSC